MRGGGQGPAPLMLLLPAEQGPGPRLLTARLWLKRGNWLRSIVGEQIWQGF